MGIDKPGFEPSGTGTQGSGELREGEETLTEEQIQQLLTTKGVVLGDDWHRPDQSSIKLLIAINPKNDEVEICRKRYKTDIYKRIEYLDNLYFRGDRGGEPVIENEDEKSKENRRQHLVEEIEKRQETIKETIEDLQAEISQYQKDTAALEYAKQKTLQK